MTPAVQTNWKLWPWSAHSADDEALQEASLLDAATVEGMFAKIADVPADATAIVKINAGMLRTLLAAHHRSATVRGAEITDPDRRVSYRATIGRGDGRVWLRSVEIIPDDPDPDARVWRVPHQAIAEAVALQLAEEDRVAANGWFQVGPNRIGDGIPTPEELAELLRRGENRHTIAARYDRSTSRVDDWLRAARRDRPDLDWPRRRRGPKPRTTQTEGTPQ